MLNSFGNLLIGLVFVNKKHLEITVYKVTKIEKFNLEYRKGSDKFIFFSF